MNTKSFIACSLILLTGAANAGTLFSQPFDSTAINFTSSQNDTTGGNGNFATVYDDFTLTSNSNVNGFSFTGAYFNPPTQGVITGFTLTFYTDSGGTPGAAIATLALSGAGSETSLGTVAGNPTFSYNLSFSAIHMSAGTYWASVVPDLGFPPQWGWGTSQVGNFNAKQRFFGSLSSTGTNQAFDVLGAVPEPETYLLMLAGLAGVAAFARGRKSA